MTEKKRMSRRTGAAVAAAGVAAVVAGFGIGSAAAASNLLFPSPAGLVAEDGTATTPMPAPTYSTNANGESFGSAADAASPAAEPDLISVITTNGLTPQEAAALTPSEVADTRAGGGEQGFVRKAELDKANGSDVKTPAEAVEWMRTGALEDHVVTVYKSDGVTPIGQFVVYGLESQTADIK